MKRFGKRTLSVLLAGSMLLGDAAAAVMAAPVYAQSPEEKPKYISDVFIAYGKTENEAKEWLRNNGWEPIEGNSDFNAGKSSYDGENVAAVMGIKRTDDSKCAITDMAVMNMKGQYSFNDYKELLKEKNGEINGLIDSILPAINEYRENYNIKDEEDTRYKRAETAYNLLNKLKDGEEGDKYAVNDTRRGLGDLLLEPLMQEGGGEGSGDLRQIILESSGAVLMAIENSIAIAADTGDDTWLDRLVSADWEYLAEHVADFCPEAGGVDVAPSAVENYYMQSYGDTADIMLEQWDEIHEKMVWYEDYRSKHGLDRMEGESDEEYSERTSETLAKLKESEENDQQNAEFKRFCDYDSLYTGLNTVEYSGEWGDTLGSFFNPEGDDSYASETASYLPLAVALSEGQKSTLDSVSLYKMLLLGLASEKAVYEMSERVYEVLGDREDVSVYAGINRAIFRNGVALTPAVLIDSANGNGFFDWDTQTICNIITYVGVPLSAIILVSAYGVYDRAQVLAKRYHLFHELPVDNVRESLSRSDSAVSMPVSNNTDDSFSVISHVSNEAEEIAGTKQAVFKTAEEQVRYNLRVGISVVLAGVGIMLAAASIASKIYAINEEVQAFKNKTFSEIPNLIVDEKDIVSYRKDKNGKDQKCIDFKQHLYYEAVKCNRQEAGKLSKWQDGVDKYTGLGCGDLADLNCDHGKEWLALYTVKATEKGSPILADSLSLVYAGADTKTGDLEPENAPYRLHYFSNLGSINLADKAFCYNNASDKTQIGFFWNVDDTVK